tara:strand:+ start:80 stop:505 length:426 start_codon:yes stop_codon:yes gene_type:complete
MSEVKEKPRTYKYILAWIIASLMSNILIRIMDFLLSDIMISDGSDFNLYFVISGLLCIPIISGSFIFIYNMFKSLNLKKVMIYIYILGGLGLCAAMGQTIALYKALEIILPSTYFIVSIISFVISVLIIRFYYKSKPDRWY